ncbi:uncharacterized protein LOC125681904 isoform X1 [Ostrea edulis]|uniref:uncharacterized protein LOC125681904 isoform X1 n=1 Tax=Ostrea edulis TaxID=37623 RepID=UPI0024AFFDA6|nr:uncharacterized protein LOC125681904 isoform X1 [Ostrea edulis]
MLLLKNIYINVKMHEFLLIYQICLMLGSWAAISCFTCPDRIAYPRDCPFVSHCGHNEICYVDEFVTPDGHTFYRSGCRSKSRCGLSGKREIPLERRQVGVGGEIKTCEECCTSDHCNYGGCGQPPPPKRGPICYNCFQQQQEEGCNRVTICPENCECHIMRSPDSLTMDLVFTTGCVRKSTCHPGQLTSGSPVLVVGKRQNENDYNLASRDVEKRAGFCFSCCPNDLCNRNCSNAHSHAASTTPQPVTASSTSVSTTSTSTPTTGSTTTTSTTIKPTSTPTTTTSTTSTPTTTTSTTTLPPTTKSTTTTPTTTSTTTSTTSTTKAPATCPADFLQYLNHCYYFSTEIKYWGEALQICKLKGAYLAKIEDQLEENFIQSVIQPLMNNNQIPKHVWGYYIGAHLVQGKWQWSDGVALNYTNWGNNEPDHPGEQNFGFIFLPGHYAGDYKWGSHRDMQGTSRYICEKDLI